MIGGWYMEVHHLYPTIDKIVGLKGGLVQIISANRTGSDVHYRVRDFKTDETFFFEDFILELGYRRVREAEVVLYARKPIKL